MFFCAQKKPHILHIIKQKRRPKNAKKHKKRKKNMFSQETNGFTVGLVSGHYVLVLSNVCSADNGQHCELHAVCGQTVCLGEVGVVEKTIQADGQEVLRGIRLRDGDCSCIFGHIPVKELRPEIADYFANKVVQVIELEDDEIKNSAKVNGVIKVVVVGTSLK